MSTCGTVIAWEHGLKAAARMIAIIRSTAPRAEMTTTAGETHWLDGLAHRVGLDTDATHVAETIVSTVREIETALRPVIGPTGFDALYSRCVYLAGLDHPWL